MSMVNNQSKVQETKLLKELTKWASETKEGVVVSVLQLNFPDNPTSCGKQA
jgi:hypothetical protein